MDSDKRDKREKIMNACAHKLKRNYEDYWDNESYKYLLSLGPDKLFRKVLENIFRFTNSTNICLVLGIAGDSKLISIYTNNIIGINISIEEINKARLATQKLIRLILCDAEMLPFRRCQFNNIICKSTLHHLNLNKAILEIYRVLNFKGLLTLYEPGLINPVAIIGRLFFPSSIHVETERPFIWRNLRKHLIKFDICLEEQFIIFSSILPIFGKYIKLLRNRVLLKSIYKIDELACKTKLKELSWLGIICARK